MASTLSHLDVAPIENYERIPSREISDWGDGKIPSYVSVDFTARTRRKLSVSFPPFRHVQFQKNALLYAALFTKALNGTKE